MLTMFFGKRNKFKVFILWRVRAELNFSFLSYDLVYTWNCVSAAVLVWWWQTVSGMTTIIGIHLLGIMNIHTKSHKDVGSSWWGILQLMNSKLIDQQRRPAGWARSQKRNVLPAGVGWGNKIKSVQPLESQISSLNCNIFIYLAYMWNHFGLMVTEPKSLGFILWGSRILTKVLILLEGSECEIIVIF